MQLKEEYLPPLLALTEYAAKKLNAVDDQGLIRSSVEFALDSRRSGVKVTAHWSDFDKIEKLLDEENPAHYDLWHMPLYTSCQSVSDVDAAITRLEGHLQIAADLLAGDAA